MIARMMAWWPWVRFHKPMYARQKLGARWVWTPVTKRFGHGGWVYLSLSWLWRFRNGV